VCVCVCVCVCLFVRRQFKPKRNKIVMDFHSINPGMFSGTGWTHSPWERKKRERKSGCFELLLL
jgi:hypothetical protein